jgi:hypothetical protein
MAKIVLTNLLEDYTSDELDYCLSQAYDTKFDTKEVVKVKIQKEDTFIRKSFKADEIEVLKAGKKREKHEPGIDMKELKKLEEGFKMDD